MLRSLALCSQMLFQPTSLTSAETHLDAREKGSPHPPECLALEAADMASLLAALPQAAAAKVDGWRLQYRALPYSRDFATQVR